jgi:pilus assembly protein Flp/PilA
MRRPQVGRAIGQEIRMKLVARLLADREAATAVEYALLATIVSLAAITAIGNVSNALVNVFVAVATDMSNSGSGSL